MPASGFMTGVACFCRRRRRSRSQTNAIISATPAQPPTTPPAIVPALLDDVSDLDSVAAGRFVFVSVGIADVDGVTDADVDADGVPSVNQRYAALARHALSDHSSSSWNSPLAMRLSRLCEGLSSSPLPGSAQAMPAPPSLKVCTKPRFPCRQQK